MGEQPLKLPKGTQRGLAEDGRSHIIGIIFGWANLRSSLVWCLWIAWKEGDMKLTLANHNRNIGRGLRGALALLVVLHWKRLSLRYIKQAMLAATAVEWAFEEGGP